MVDRFAEAINTIKNNEYVGREECIVYSTNLVKKVLDLLKENGYIEGYEEFSERYAKKLRIKLSKRINNIGVIKPRYQIKNSQIIDFEQRYIPSKDFGILIISSPVGITTNKSARESGTGGRLLAYVY
jgi:Ribosomal protein S8